MNLNYLTEFEEFVCKKRGNTNNLPTLRGNQEMLSYIVKEVLCLDEEGYRAVYSTDFNKKFGTYKYIKELISLDKNEEYFGKNSKERIIAAIFPQDSKNSKNKEIIYMLNQNDKATLRYFSKTKNRKKADEILFSYLQWLLENVMRIDTENDLEELYAFLSRAEKIGFVESLSCFSSIKQDYFCLLDFYFFNLPKSRREREIYNYLDVRGGIENGRDFIARILKVRELEFFS